MMHEHERVYYLTLTHDTSSRVKFVKVDILYKWLVLMYITYATPLYTGHRDDCSPLPFHVIQVSVVNFSRDRVMYTETNCSLTSTLLARCQNLAQPHVLFTDTARLTVLCVRSRDTSVIGTRTNRRRESVDITNERLRAYHVAITRI